MWQKELLKTGLVVLLISLLMVGTLALASGANYSVSWWSVDSGGGIGASSSYTLSSTVGQPDAGGSVSSSFTLSGGFWHAEPADDAEYTVFIPIVVNQE